MIIAPSGIVNYIIDMLISHSHKFVTIDIPKTGTRSMRETLNPLGIIDVIGKAGVTDTRFLSARYSLTMQTTI